MSVELDQRLREAREGDPATLERLLEMDRRYLGSVRHYDPVSFNLPRKRQ